MDKYNLSVVRQSFANAVFTHKVQEVAAERVHRYVLSIKIANIILVSLILITLFLQVNNPEKSIFSSLSIGLTIGEVLFLIVQLTFSFEEKALSHKSAALKYLGVRNRYINLIADIMGEKTSNTEVKTKRDSLQMEYQVISDLSPQTERKDFNISQERLNKKGVVQGEDFTWSNEEINRFLPEALHLSNS